jgi:hypothetical protein
MSLSDEKKKRLKEIPGIDTLILKIKKDYPVKDIPESLISRKAKEFIENLRQDIVSGNYDCKTEVNPEKTSQ